MYVHLNYLLNNQVKIWHSINQVSFNLWMEWLYLELRKFTAGNDSSQKPLGQSAKGDTDNSTENTENCLIMIKSGRLEILPPAFT